MISDVSSTLTDSRVHVSLFILIPAIFSVSSTMDNRESSYPYFNLPGLNYKSYSMLGDINIGALMALTESNPCFTTIRSQLWIFRSLEGVAFAVDQVNSDSSILPNLTLGFVTLDYCRSNNMALAQSLAFLPMKEADGTANRCDSSFNISKYSNNSRFDGEMSSPNAGIFEPPRHFDVIGITGPFGSASSVPISNLYAIAKRPIVSYMATSDVLSDKGAHPYFMRVVPPDKVQVRALLTFIADNSWSYISVAYSSGAYGETAFDNIESMAGKFNICIATSHKIDSDRTDFDKVAKDLLRYQRARAVILFTGADNSLAIVGATKRAGASGHFIWIGSDAISDKILGKNQYWEELVGAFTFLYYSISVPEYDEYFTKLTVNGSHNPWLKSYFEHYGQCSFESGSCKKDAQFGDFVQNEVLPSASLVLDSVLTFAHAADRLLKTHCPNVSPQDARACIEDELLLKYMLNSSFDGYTGKIEFDGDGNLLGKYAIRQMKWREIRTSNGSSEIKKILVETPVAAFDISSDSVDYTGPAITWDHLKNLPRIIPLTEGVPPSDVPESVCSRPCAAGEYKLQQELVCCWECRRCRSNERIKPGNKGCEACLEFTWPEPSTNYTTCSPIPLSYSSVSDTLSLIQVCLAIVAIVGQILVASAYINLRDSRVIKAASRELSILQMVAIFVGYITVILFQTPPTAEICAVLYFMFCLSFAWLYSPLIVKAVRIYRIFQSASKTNRRPRFTSPQSQIVMAVVLIAVQVLLCLVIYSMFKPTAIKTQPVAVERYVELTCDLTLPGLTSFLAYNLVLISVCAALAFKTRKLPDNFNESWFMFMCVSTTLVIWLAIVPTYFTASRENARTLLLSVALLLNHTVALAFLFIPKIYAAVYVSPANFVVSRFHTNTSISQAVDLPGLTNRVAPVSSRTQYTSSGLTSLNGTNKSITAPSLLSVPASKSKHKSFARGPDVTGAVKPTTTQDIAQIEKAIQGLRNPKSDVLENERKASMPAPVSLLPVTASNDHLAPHYMSQTPASNGHAAPVSRPPAPVGNGHLTPVSESPVPDSNGHPGPEGVSPDPGADNDHPASVSMPPAPASSYHSAPASVSPIHEINGHPSANSVPSTTASNDHPAPDRQSPPLASSIHPALDSVPPAPASSGHTTPGTLLPGSVNNSHKAVDTADRVTPTPMSSQVTHSSNASVGSNVLTLTVPNASQRVRFTHKNSNESFT